MKKILISWWAYQSDFIDKSNLLNKEDSPNYNYHKYFYEQSKNEQPVKQKTKEQPTSENQKTKYSQHIIVSTADPNKSTSADYQKFIYLLQQLNVDFPKHKLIGEYVPINDLLDFKEIKTKTEELLLKFKDYEIDIFFSPGNSIMQMAWLICHFTLGLNSHLLQMRPAKFTDQKRPVLLKVNIEPSEFPHSAIIRDNNLNLRLNETCISSTGYIGESLLPVYSLAEKVANTDKISVIIYGETGTGKELIARYIHNQSSRAKMPFEVVNCGALPETLLESNLLGYEKNAFTGATEKRSGIFKQADKGTVFLDEIGDISPKMQQILLRVLQERKIRPIQGKEEPIDVRIITATNKNLEKECEKGNFRWDLFYRLTGIEIFLPPLREWSKKDKQKLIERFILQKMKEFNKSFQLEMSKDALDILLMYSFPGNIRQLEHIIEGLYVMKDKDNYKINEKDLSGRYLTSNEPQLMKWVDVEKNHIIKILRMCKGNKRKANEYIGYKSINTLYSKIKEYNIEEPDII